MLTLFGRRLMAASKYDIDKLNQALDALEGAQNKPCFDCKFFEGSQWIAKEDMKSYGKCRHPIVATPKLCPVSGDISYDNVYAKNVRRMHEACGPEGDLFQDKPLPEVKKNWFTKLFS